jgi:HlyD family secretion protein
MVAILLFSVMVSGCQLLPFRQTAEAQPLTTVDVKRGTLVITVTSSGTITLPQIAKLGFSGAVSGSQAGNAILSELNVSMGSHVTRGQVIARLDTSDQERELLRLQNNLDTAILTLEKAKQPLYKPEEIAKAEDAVVTAKANLVVAEEALKKARNPYTENDFARAEGDVRNARIALANAEQELEATIRSQTIAVQDAMENVIRLQKLLDQGPYRSGSTQSTTSVTEFDVYKANENLLVIRTQAESAISKAKNDVAKARDALAAAEFTFNDMLSKKEGDPLEIAQKESSLVNARVAVANAERTLSLMKEPPDPIDIKLKEAQVTTARLQVEDAKRQLEKCTIIAPFDGIVGDFKAKVGDTIQPGSFVIPVVDTTLARVDAYVEEYDVNSVRVGMPAVITIDAIRGQTFSGVVDAISPVSTVQQGVVRYAITIKIQVAGSTGATSAPRTPAGSSGSRATIGGGQPAGRQSVSADVSSGAGSELKDGMSATARIIINQKDNVLLVPNRALMFQSGVQKVQVLANGEVRDRVVKTGMTSDEYTEITEGLSEGDKVVIPAATSSQQSTQRMPTGPGGSMMPMLR